MNLTMVVLRLVHLFSAVLWVGFTFGLNLFITPTVQAVGADAQKFMQHFTKKSGVTRWMTVAGGLTVLSGLWMYYYLFGPLAPLNTGSGLALTVGGVAGVSALLVGLRVGRTTKQIGALGEKLAAGGQPDPADIASMQDLQESMGRLGAITAILMVIALTGMTLSEYFAF